ncbi:monocarboxylate transporter 12, partial [Parasteatoda tepidariorum]|uniref:monocarboxylate transporter 12 n=1 Tax=Parasteatoda tepidariorum TaxID=114398 RepID=UPI0039BD22A5
MRFALDLSISSDMSSHKINARTMKEVPEEEEEEEVWSSRTTPPPKLPGTLILGGDPEDWSAPEPPDGGWGWVIVFASFFCNVVVDGIAYSFGVFLIHFVDYYGTSKGKTAWVGSLLTGCYLLAGPVVSALTNKFGCRPVTVAGSIISCLAFLLSIFAPPLDVLMLTYGISAGIGFGLIYLPAIVSVGYYFSTKRAFATGIAVCGSGMGAFLFAPLTQLLLETYDWKGALLIMAGLSLNCAVFGSLMRPLNPPSPHNKCGGMESMTQLNTEPGVHSTLNLDEVSKPLLCVPPREEHLRKSVDIGGKTPSSQH